MGLFKWMAIYAGAKHLLNTTQPQPVTVQLDIDLPDDEEDEEECGCFPPREVSAADLRCIYVDEDCEGGPRYFAPDGWETDRHGSPLSTSTSRALQEYLCEKAKRKK